MTTRTPDEHFDGRPYGRLLVPDAEGGFSAEILEFPGCFAEGETAEEAVANLERTAKAWIESEQEQQHGIPEPICGDEYSGRLALRLPRSLHRLLALRAARDRTSINQEVVAAVAAWVGADDAWRQVSERLAQRAAQILVVPMTAWPTGFTVMGNWAPGFWTLSVQQLQEQMKIASTAQVVTTPALAGVTEGRRG